jgi:hypothetical protein
MIWLGDSRGYMTDWITQLWVRATGRRVDLSEMPWLDGPAGPPRGIGMQFFSELAARNGLTVQSGGSRGLLADFGALAAADFDPSAVHASVAEFYTRTSDYGLDAWAEWCGMFRPFGWLLARMFSRRLQQLNVPLSGLDTSRGMTSDVLQLVDPTTGTVRHTAWVRQLLGSGHVLYAGDYSLVSVPGRRGPCIRVVFPLPNGNAMVIMRPHAHPDGSFSVVSAGRGFGDAGFYFTVRDGDRAWARYLRALKESIRVYPRENGVVRADHVLTLWGTTFLRLHYRLSIRTSTAETPAAVKSDSRINQNQAPPLRPLR